MCFAQALVELMSEMSAGYSLSQPRAVRMGIISTMNQFKSVTPSARTLYGYLATTLVCPGVTGLVNSMIN